ncbi:MAG: SMC-Scp complex subunit ScpB [Balneolaceae bacterium]
MLDYQFVDGTRLTAVIESLVFASPDPISWEKIADIVQQGEDELQLDEKTVRAIIDQLNNRYEENGLSFRIDKVAGGFTFVTQDRYHPWLSIFQHENAYRRLSQSAMETLAIVAYRQPITKPEVDQIRGVDSGYILRQLLEKMLVRVSGRADSPGKPLLYKTTDYFLKHFGLNTVDELPKPREIDEILKDDDMAEHRRLLMERQMELEEDEEADAIIEEYIEKFHGGEGDEKDEGEPDGENAEEGTPDQQAEESGRPASDTHRNEDGADNGDEAPPADKKE